MQHIDLLHKLQPWLAAVVDLVDVAPANDAAAARERCKAAVERAREGLRDDRVLRDKERDFARALVAVLDEFGVRRFPRFGEWKSLQLELFDETRLGDDIVLEIERLCREGRPRSEPERAFVYYLCLALGFKGRYGDVHVAADGEKRLVALRLRLREALVEARWFPEGRIDDLGAPPTPPGLPPPPGPAPVWPWLLAFCVLLGVATEYVVLRHFAQAGAAEVERQIVQPRAPVPRNRN